MRTGFQKMWGMETVDLLSNRHILPSEEAPPPRPKLQAEAWNSINCATDIFRLGPQLYITNTAVLTIYGPMIYTAPRIRFLMRADGYRCEGGGGVLALEIESFVGPVEIARADRRVLFGAHKTRDFQRRGGAPPPPPPNERTKKKKKNKRRAEFKKHEKEV